jgi:hypothetical protein|tara:strand:+ start:17726 stop:18055 length:330 start_codon:yes stop_codon:yes gene_type:complete
MITPIKIEAGSNSAKVDNSTFVIKTHSDTGWIENLGSDSIYYIKLPQSLGGQRVSVVRLYDVVCPVCKVVHVSAELDHCIDERPVCVMECPEQQNFIFYKKRIDPNNRD